MGGRKVYTGMGGRGPEGKGVEGGKSRMSGRWKGERRRGLTLVRGRKEGRRLKATRGKIYSRKDTYEMIKGFGDREERRGVWKAKEKGGKLKKRERMVS